MKSKKNKMVSLRLTDEQARYLENAVRFLEDETGSKVSRASVMLRLMEKGLPALENEMNRLRSQGNARSRRFPQLQLTYLNPVATSV